MNVKKKSNQIIIGGAIPIYIYLLDVGKRKSWILGRTKSMDNKTREIIVSLQGGHQSLITVAAQCIYNTSE